MSGGNETDGIRNHKNNIAVRVGLVLDRFKSLVRVTKERSTNQKQHEGYIVINGFSIMSSLEELFTSVSIFQVNKQDRSD